MSQKTIIWFWSTGVFAVQLLIGTIIYMKYGFALAAVSGSFVLFIVSAAVFYLAVILFLTSIDPDGDGSAFVIGLLVATFIGILAIAESNGGGESQFLFFVTTLPAGIVTVYGGTTFLVRKLSVKRSAVHP